MSYFCRSCCMNHNTVPAGNHAKNGYPLCGKAIARFNRPECVKRGAYKFSRLKYKKGGKFVDFLSSL